MRVLLATSIGVAAAAALLLPLAPTGSADFTLSDKPAASQGASHDAARDTAGDAAQDAVPPTAHDAAARGRDGRIPGRTQSLSLNAPDARTQSGERLLSAWQADPAGGQRLASRHVRRFSLVGVVWSDVRTVPRGRIQVQTRATTTGHWTPWRSLNVHGDDRPDRDAAERAGERPLGSTAPVWVGSSDAVRVRVVPDGAPGARRAGGSAQPRLPAGMRLELVDPGPSEPEADRPENNPYTGGAQTDSAGRPAAPEKVPGGVLPSLSAAETRATYGRAGHAGSHIGPRPAIVTRKGWGADESMRQGQFLYTGSVKAAFVHHTAETNNYSCAQAPAIIRGIYRYHVKSSHWRDIGYNFLIDKCGKIYEGRAGGVARAVMGAHTYGFNTDTTGIAVLGSYGTVQPARAVTDAIAHLSAWKLGLGGVDAGGKVVLTSGGGTKYKKGAKVSFQAVSGHRDGYVTDCPGNALYAKLPAIREEAGRLQGR